MKTTSLGIAFLAFYTISAAATEKPVILPMGVEVVDQDGITVVREVPRELSQLGKRCRECVHVGGHCTIGDGSCYGREHASCTWCGNGCRSICIPYQEACSKWC